MYLRISSTWYNEVTFADYDVSFNTRHMYHAIIQSMYQSKLFNEEGNMNPEEVEKWSRLFGNEAPADWDF